MITLYADKGKASLTPHMILNEIGRPFDLVLVDCDAGEQRSAAYLRINPHGRVPALVDDGLVLYETVAIVLHLVERFPGANLAPPPGSSERSIFYRWIAHLGCSIQPEMRAYFYAKEQASDPRCVAEAKQMAEGRIRAAFEIIDQQLGQGPFLLGEQYCAADPYLTMLVRWTRNMTNPARTLPNIAAHAERVLARPNVKRTLEREGLALPYV
jgi:glutathione S-transferase